MVMVADIFTKPLPREQFEKVNSDCSKSQLRIEKCCKDNVALSLALFDYIMLILCLALIQLHHTVLELAIL